MNKRFLGLGFTFTAQDRGLGKKLTEYSDTLKSIKESLDSIKASGATGVVMGEPISQARGYAPKPSGAVQAESSGMSSAIPTDRIKAEKPKGQVVYSDETKQFLSKLSKAVPQHLFGGITTELKDLHLKFDSFGNMLDESKKRLLDHASKMVEAEKAMKKTKFVQSLRAAVEYLRGIGHAFSNLLDSFGVRLRDMIPPQLSAAFGVIKAIVAGPLNLLKSITGNTINGLMKKQVNAVDKLKEDLNEQIGNKSGPSLKDLLMDAGKPEKEKENGGLFARLLEPVRRLFSALLEPLKLLIIPLFELGKSAVAAAWNFGKMLISTEGRAALLEKFAGAIGRASGAFTRFGKWLGSLGEAFSFLRVIKGSFLITSITATISGLMEKLDVMKYGFTLLWDGIKEFAGGLADVISMIAGKIWGKVYPVLSQAVSDGVGAFKLVFSPLIDMIVKAFDIFVGIYKKAGNFLGDFFSVSGDIVGGALKSAGKDMKAFAASQRNSDISDSIKSRSEDIRANSDAILERGMSNQQEEQRRTNDLLSQLLQMQSNGGTNKVSVSLNTKGSLASLFGNAEINAARTARP